MSSGKRGMAAELRIGGVERRPRAETGIIQEEGKKISNRSIPSKRANANPQVEVEQKQVELHFEEFHPIYPCSSRPHA